MSSHLDVLGTGDSHDALSNLIIAVLTI